MSEPCRRLLRRGKGYVVCDDEINAPHSRKSWAFTGVPTGIARITIPRPFGAPPFKRGLKGIVYRNVSVDRQAPLAKELAAPSGVD